MASWWESLSKKWFPFLGYVVYKKRPVAVENTLEIQPRNGKDPPKIDDCLIENPLKNPNQDPIHGGSIMNNPFGNEF